MVKGEVGVEADLADGVIELDDVHLFWVLLEEAGDGELEECGHWGGLSCIYSNVLTEFYCTISESLGKQRMKTSEWKRLLCSEQSSTVARCELKLY